MILANVFHSFIVMATVIMIVNYDHTVITIKNYDPRTFILQATGLIFASMVRGAYSSGAPENKY